MLAGPPAFATAGAPTEAQSTEAVGLTEGLTDSTIASMPARIGSGRSGQAVMTLASSSVSLSGRPSRAPSDSPECCKPFSQRG